MEKIIQMKIEITPEILAKIFWEMDDGEQSEFFNALYIEANGALNLQDQLDYVVKNSTLSEDGMSAMTAFYWVVKNK